MVAASNLPIQNLNLDPLCSHGLSSPPKRQFCCAYFPSISFSSKFHFPGEIKWSGNGSSRFKRFETMAVSSLDSQREISGSECALEYDVVIIGAGIIGLTIARQFLMESDLSVAVVDKAIPCSGATGAGQGYLWMVHKTPGSDIWDLATRSHQLWKLLAESLRDQGLNPAELLGWKEMGSLLVGRTSEELDSVKRRVKQLSGAGLRAEFVAGSDLLLMEPTLNVKKGTGAAFLPGDCQLDAHRVVDFIEKANNQFLSQKRYAKFYNDPVTSFLRSSISKEIVAVQTLKHTLYCKKGVVVAAGSWSGSLMVDLAGKLEDAINVPVKPRKGHLLLLENFNSLKLNHGLMEVGYVNHQTSASHPDEEALSVSMTATLDIQGNLLLGSSRQFVGFSTKVDDSIIKCIWERASEFLPKLKELDLSDYQTNQKVRVGLRAYMPDGKPVIGPVPGLSNVLFATGHEGGGLSLVNLHPTHLEYITSLPCLSFSLAHIFVWREKQMANNMQMICIDGLLTVSAPRILLLLCAVKGILQAWHQDQQEELVRRTATLYKARKITPWKVFQKTISSPEVL